MLTFCFVRGPSFVAGGTNSIPSYPQNREREWSDRRSGFPGALDMNGLASAQNFGVSQVQQPLYGSPEEAESAFMKMLKRHNVDPDWTWEQTMRETIKDPQYRALRDPKHRRAAFNKYAVEVRAQEKDRAKERFAKLRTDFNIMLKRHPEIKHYSRWKTIRPILEGETTFRSTDDEGERRRLFHEYVVELRKANAEQEAETRKQAISALTSILKSLDLEPYTRWSEAEATLLANNKIQTDEKFMSLSKCDVLSAFENHIKSLERTFNDARQQSKTTRVRKERHSREQFIDLLKELKFQGEIKAGTKWMNIYPLFQDDPRYLAMLGQAGSSPLDLFWDMVEEEERSLRGPRNYVLDFLDVSNRIASRQFFFFFLLFRKLTPSSRTLDTISRQKPPLKNFALLRSPIVEQPVSTLRLFCSSSNGSRKRLSDDTKKKGMQPIAIRDARWMHCALELSTWIRRSALQIPGSKFVQESRDTTSTRLLNPIVFGKLHSTRSFVVFERRKMTLTTGSRADITTTVIVTIEETPLLRLADAADHPSPMHTRLTAVKHKPTGNDRTGEPVLLLPSARDEMTVIATPTTGEIVIIRRVTTNWNVVTARENGRDYTVRVRNPAAVEMSWTTEQIPKAQRALPSADADMTVMQTVAA